MSSNFNETCRVRASRSWSLGQESLILVLKKGDVMCCKMSGKPSVFKSVRKGKRKRASAPNVSAAEVRRNCRKKKIR